MREGAQREAGLLVEEAEAEAGRVRNEARVEADAVRGEAEERVRHRLLAAQAAADEMRIAARRDVKENRGEALGRAA